MRSTDLIGHLNRADEHLHEALTWIDDAYLDDEPQNRQYYRADFIGQTEEKINAALADLAAAHHMAQTQVPESPGYRDWLMAICRKWKPPPEAGNPFQLLGFVMHLNTYADRQGRICVPLSALAANCDNSSSTVKRLRRRAEDCELIKRTGEYRGNVPVFVRWMPPSVTEYVLR